MPSMHPSWYELYPERLERERLAYSRADFMFELDEEMLRLNRIMIFRGVTTVGGKEYPLSVLYPPGFPFVRPEVVSAETRLSRHQDPYGRNLCLLENTAVGWIPAMTGADMIQQAANLLNDSLVRGPDAVHENEVDAPEPWSTYYPYGFGTSLVVPPEMQALVDGSWGQFWMRTTAPEDPLRGLLSKLTIHVPGKGSARISEARTSLRSLFPGSEVSGLWLRAREALPWFTDFGDLRDWARDQLRGRLRDFDRQIGAFSRAPAEFGWSGMQALAVCYQEEGPARGQTHDTWLATIMLPPSGERRGAVHVLRPHLLAEQASFARTPALRPLRGKKVAIVGLGALGSEIAVRLTRAGVGTFLLADYEAVEVGNLARQDWDIRDLGLPKVTALARRLRTINPDVEITELPMRLGGISDVRYPEMDTDQLAKFAETVSGYDLLIGTTGDGWINHLMNRIGCAQSIPMLFTWVTNGAWGGEILRVMPDECACYECMAIRYAAGDLERVPQEDSAADLVFPLGCGSPTFTGTGFDTGSVSLLAARLAVQTLLRSEPDAYPDAPYHYMQWDSRGAGVGEWPKIYEGTIHRHPACTTCGSAAS